jgi:hypothetical protein
VSHEAVDCFVELQTRSESAQVSEMGLGNFPSVLAAQRIRPARYRLNARRPTNVRRSRPAAPQPSSRQQHRKLPWASLMWPHYRQHNFYKTAHCNHSLEQLLSSELASTFSPIEVIAVKHEFAGPQANRPRFETTSLNQISCSFRRPSTPNPEERPTQFRPASAVLVNRRVVIAVSTVETFR